MNIYVKNKKSLKDEILNIKNGIKNNFLTKDKKIIWATIKKILIILLVAIIIKIPFIFIETLVLDMLNKIGISVLLQDIMEFIFNVLYIFVAFIYIYNRLKKNYANK